LEPDYRLILDALGEAVIAADRAGRITYANAAAEALLGWEEGGLRGLPVTAVIPPHLRSRHTAGFNRYRSTWAPRILGRGIPVPARRRNGVEVRIELTLTAFRGRGGEELYLAALHPEATASAPDRASIRPDSLSALLEAAQQLESAGATSERTVARQLERALEYHFDASHAQLWLYDPTIQALRVPIGRGEGPAVAPPSIATQAAIAREPVLQRSETGPLIIPDIQSNGPLTGVAAFPLVSAGELLGVLVYGSRSPLSREALRPLTLLVRLAVDALNAVRRQSAEAERDRQAERVRAQSEIAGMLAERAPTDVVLDRIVSKALELTGLDEGIVLVRTDDAGRGVVCASAGSKQSRVGERVTGAVDAASQALASGQIESIDDSRDVRHASLRQRGVRCVIAAPIRVGGATVGALQLAGRKASRTITTNDEDTISLLAGQAALVLARE